MRIACVVAIVMVGGCSPNFESLFAAGGGPVDASARDGGDVPDSIDTGGNEMDAGADGEAGSCASRSCSPVPICLGKDCTYACEGCGCVCPVRNCSAPATESCTATCGAETSCDVSCDPDVPIGNRRCTFSAHRTRTAAYKCGEKVDTCEATCDRGAVCALACAREAKCSLKCLEGARCALICGGALDCTLECSSGAVQTCSNGTKTCNRSCP